MAKKQQPKLSYGPNMGLIAGEAAVAQSEANLGNAVGAFAQGFQTVFGAIQKEEEERAAKMEAYAAEFPGLEQMNFMANATNKQVVTDFLNTQRDEYSKLAATYEKTKDRKVMDKMNAIKFSIANLDDQIKVFNQDKQEYRTAFDENQLADPQVFDKDFYTNIFTNNAKFSIAENGDIAFDVSGKKNKSNLYKDHAGNWTSRNNISESSFLEMYSKAQASGEKGNAFYRDTTYRALLSNLKATGNEGLQTFVTTDLTGDNSDFTFQQQWASGSLDDKFYKGRKKEDGTDWMFDNKNAGELRKLVADYYTDVVEDGYDTGKKNYKDPNANATDSGDELDFYSKGNKVQLIDNQFLSGNSADALYSDIQSGTSFDAKDPITKEINNYSYQIVDEAGGWYQNYQEGDNPKTKESYIGGADDIADVFTNDPRFNNLETKLEQEVSITGGADGDLMKLKNQSDLTKKTGIDRSLFQKRGDEVAKMIKQFLPKDYDIVSGREYTFAGRKGEGLFNTDDNYIQIINIKNPDEKYEFNTLYVSDPVKAQKQFDDFFNKFKNKLVQTRLPGE